MNASGLANAKFDFDHDIFNEGRLVIQTLDYLLIAAVKNVSADGFTLNDFVTLNVICPLCVIFVFAIDCLL